MDKCPCGKDGKYRLLSKEGVPAPSCNKHTICPTYGELVAKVEVLSDALSSYRVAMEETCRYVGYKSLPYEEGRVWHDVDKQAEEALDGI